MSYQNVGTPVFYVNNLEFLASNGFISINNIFRTLPVTPSKETISENFTVPSMNDNIFLAVLGHLGASESTAFRIYNGGVDGTVVTPTDTVVNAVIDGDSITTPYNGFSIATYNTAIDSTLGVNYWDNEKTAGSLVIGTYYTMPHAPDLNLTMTREYSGIKTIETKGGSSLSNDFGSKNPKWGGLPAWGLGDGTSNSLTSHDLSSSGRRIWDLSFSYILDSDLFPDVSSLNAIESLHPDGGDFVTDHNPIGNTLLDDPNFYSQVVHKTNGGQLPFIFQPDSTNNNPDQFAICKFDQSSFQFKQVANSVYDVSLKIREVW